MAFWLMKSEPDVYPWSKLVADKRGSWDGVRNHLAKLNLKAMKKGDKAFFYHSNIGKEVVGIVEVSQTSAPDSTTDDPRWDCVHIRAVRPLLRPVTLETCKSHPGLEKMVLVNNSRLSVQPVSLEEWRIVCALGGVDP